MNKNIIILLFTIIAFSDIEAQVSEEKPFIEINGTAELECYSKSNIYSNLFV